MSHEERACGACTACCEGWLFAIVKEKEIYPGHPCRHRVPGGGCAIYEERPEKPCREFYCGWIQAPELLEEAWRPDRSGAIVILDRDWEGWEVIRLVPTGEKVPEAALEHFKALARKTGKPLLIGVREVKDGKFVRMRNLGYGPPAFVQQVRVTVSGGDIYMGSGRSQTEPPGTRQD